MSLPEILTSDTELKQLADQLARQTVIAVDLEADSLHNYREKVCLLQVSTSHDTVLIDPLAIDDLSPLGPILANPRIRKIFHAGDYDLRSLFRDFGFTVSGLFDTMISAQLLGEEKIGLADMLKKHYGLELDKKFQRADWSQRPLSPQMITYAAEDTRHLHRLAALCEQRLEELGRLAWATEEFELLEAVRFAEPDALLCVRIKGAGTLDRRQLAVLEELLKWREREAERKNRPTFKVMGNHALLAIACNTPQTRRGLAAIEGVAPRQAENYGATLLGAIRSGLEVPEDQLPSYPRPPRRVKDPEAEPLLKKLKTWRSRKAEALQLDPGVLMNNGLLEALARSRPKDLTQLQSVPGLKRWQQAEFGPELLKALSN